MTTKQIKHEIQKALDKVPDSVLEDILDYLRGVQNTGKNSVELSRHLKKILSEDRELLEKLSQ